MKHLLFTLALAASFAGADTHKSKPAAPLFVIAENALPGFPFVAMDLTEAQERAKDLTALDPVCFALPEVCAARYEATEYIGVYANGVTMKL